MANQVVLGAGGDKIGPLVLPAHNTSIVFQLKSNGLTGVSLTLQARVSQAAAFQTIQIKDPATGLAIAAVTADGQMGWAENIGYSDFQIIQTGATGGSGPADVLVNIGDDE